MMSSYPASSPWSDRFELETAIVLSGLGDRYHPESLIVITGIRNLRTWGLKLASGGSKRAKNRAVVAVARKLAILLHRLWVSGATYQPFYPNGQVA